jgi:uncharacterized protein involved in tolerance to divalent cations
MCAADLGIQNLYSTPRQMVGAFRLRCRRDRLGSCASGRPAVSALFIWPNEHLEMRQGVRIILKSKEDVPER